MNNDKVQLKVVILFIVAISFSFSAFCQSDGFMEEKDNETVFEVPTNSFSQAVQTAYTDLLSRMRNDKNALNKEISSLKSKKNLLLKTGSKDFDLLNQLSKSITEKSKQLVDLDDDLILLSSVFAEDSKEKRAKRIIDSINSKRYGVGPIVEFKEREKVKNEPKSSLKKISDSECAIDEYGLDAKTSKKKIKMSSESLIEYTHEQLESFYKEKVYLTGDVGVMLVDKTYFLVLDIIVNSKDAIKSYGVVEDGAPLKAELIDGETAYMFAESTFQGVPIPNEDKVRFQTIFVVNKPDYRMLKKSEISKLGLLWSSGYEEYEIYNIDVVKNQLDCIDKYK